MTIKGKLIHEAMDRIYTEFAKGGIQMDLIKELMSKMYDAEMVETPDEDAARWRMFVLHFGDRRARHVRNVPFFPKFSAAAFPDPAEMTSCVAHGAEWRLDCAWTERTGAADTIPKFIDLMLASRQAEEN